MVTSGLWTTKMTCKKLKDKFPQQQLVGGGREVRLAPSKAPKEKTMKPQCFQASPEPVSREISMKRKTEFQ